MKTESEARKAWCPFARSYYWAGPLHDGQPVSVNRYLRESYFPREAEKPHAEPTAPHADCLCIASACMAWRWGPEPTVQISHGETQPPVDDGPAWQPLAPDDDDAPGWWRGRHHRRGFCGLAGKPEQ